MNICKWFVEVPNVQVYTAFLPIDPECEPEPQSDTCGLSAGTVVGISITIFLVSFSAGAMLAALITYCCVRERGKSSGQHHLSPTEDPHPAPVYDEVGAGKLELKENVAYGPVETMKIEKNPSYVPVRH